MQMDTRRMILAVIFAFSLMMLWNQWNIYNAPKTPAAGQAPAAQSDALPTPSIGAAPAATQSGVAAAAPVPAGGTDYATAAKARVTTDMMVADVSAVGGDIIYLELLGHKATGDTTRNFVLLENGGEHTYLAQSGLVGGDLPNHKTVFQLVPGDYTLKQGQDSVVVRLEATTASGIKVAKLLTFKRGSYLVDVAFELSNPGAAPVNAHAYWQLARDSKAAEQTGGFFTGVTTFTGPAFYTEEKKFQKVSFSEIQDKKAEFVKKASDGWVAMVQHYFVGAYLPKGDAPREFFVDTVRDGIYSAGVMMPITLAAGQTSKYEVPLYIGPQEQKKLAGLAPGFDLVVDYGWLTVIAAPLFWLMEFIHRFVGNWGWTIIFVTIILKLIFFPLSAAGYKSMARMRTLMPRMKQLQERYANDRMKLNQEMMELYRKEKVNPMGGCFPILIQIPVFIALYWVLLGTVEMRQAPWLGWITDLSAMDKYYVLPLIMGVTQFIQTKLNPAPPDPIQAKVMLAMPIVFTFMFLWFPSGLVLYWVVNNLLSIAQQWYINRMIEGAAAQGK